MSLEWKTIERGVRWAVIAKWRGIHIVIIIVSGAVEILFFPLDYYISPHSHVREIKYLDGFRKRRTTGH